ncbi:MAG: Gfo/Idh/MocA family oxidoreductase [Promethearchaeota archaeon]|nr:MAG: Gfo/Idh/MocA family oxidoreductase [Candidatus Lokiarchaeota archaeon]
MINYGLVGYGLNGFSHVMELSKFPILQGRSNLVAGFDPNPEATQKLKELNEVKAAKSFDDFLDTPELDAIIISSPPRFHAEQAVAALESGLHVFSEVPMAIEEKFLEKIIAAEDQSGKIYLLGENYCFFSEVLYAGYLASSGKIGPIVYAESEYLHDVTYRWRKERHGDVDVPRVDSWYQQFDPLMYAHSIGPAQVAMGGIENPMPFIEVVSYSNDIGGFEGKPICSPAKAFHVGLFRTETGAIAKCANAFIFAREPTRIIIQVVGRTGTYECYQIDKPGKLFLADGHKITISLHRKGRSKKIDKDKLAEIVPSLDGLHYGASTRIMNEWLTAIENNKKSPIHAKIGANFCLAGIAASQSARSGGKPIKIKQFIE